MGSYLLNQPSCIIRRGTTAMGAESGSTNAVLPTVQKSILPYKFL